MSQIDVKTNQDNCLKLPGQGQLLKIWLKKTQETMQRCTKGHLLETEWASDVYSHHGYRCDGCLQSFDTGKVLHCEICSYDLCPSCASGSSVAGVSAEVSVEVTTEGRRISQMTGRWSRIMYYLYCISVCGLDIPAWMTRFQRFDGVSDILVDLSSDEKKQIYRMAKKYRPVLLEGKFLLQVDEGNPLLGNLSGKWVNIRAAAHLRGIAADEDGVVIFEGKRVRATKIFLCTSDWLNNSYYHPISKIEGGDCMVM